MLNPYAKRAQSPPPLSTERKIDYDDDPTLLSPGDLAFERNLAKLSSNGLYEAKLHKVPWADRSWAFADGLLGVRYTDPNFMRKKDWKQRWNFIQTHPLASMLPPLSNATPENMQQQLDRLSPIEKYDLLVGDPSTTLTLANWRETQSLFLGGNLSDWAGICEGSAAASIYFDEPIKPVELPTRDGRWHVTFHALDIKALASLLWSSYVISAPMTGSRCTEEANEENCFDVNPASLHLALVNIFNIQKRYLFADISPGNSVWNAPVYSYKIRYFNPKTGFDKGTSLDAARVPIREIRHDKYRNKRPPEAEYLVGVELELSFATGASGPVNRDGRTQAAIETRTLTYDLELDAIGNVIGGEWRSGQHPDFLWTVAPGITPQSIGDRMLGDRARWDGGPIPEEWLQPIQLASSRFQPMAAIVQKLVELSAH